MTQRDERFFAERGVHYNGHPGYVSPALLFEPPIRLGIGVDIAEGVEFGAHSYMNSGIVRPGAKIGRFCSIAFNATVGIQNHLVNLLSTHPYIAKGARDVDFVSPFRNVSEGHEETQIGHDVWIASNVVILKGVKIKTGAVIAANSVVTRDVDYFSIVGGLPAKHIRYRFDAPTQEAILKSEWWRYPLEYLQTLPVNNPSACAQRILKDKPEPYDPGFRELG